MKIFRGGTDSDSVSQRIWNGLMDGAAVCYVILLAIVIFSAQRCNIFELRSIEFDAAKKILELGKNF